MKRHIDTKIEQTKTTIVRLQDKLQLLEKQKTAVSNKNGIERWLGNNFESSCSLTPEFASFIKDFKKAVIDSTKPDFELVGWSKGHFEVSGFLKNVGNGKLVYFSISDVRYWPDEWYNNILIRTAKHDKDYTGGSNNYTEFPNLKTIARSLTQ